MMTNWLYLADRGLLGVTGADVRPFLQGLITQNMSRVTAGHIAYGALLTGQGRFLYDFFLLPGRHDNEIWIDCHAEELMPLAKELHQHQLRYQIEFDLLSDEYQIEANISTSTPEENSYVDPRLPALGLRRVVARTAHPKPQDTAYHAHRIALGIPDGHIDAEKGKTIANELCLADLNGIDFNKGCYMGQELTARTHFRTQPKKRLMQVTYTGNAPVCGSVVMRGAMECGHVYSCTNGKGIAILRLTEVAKGEPLLVNGTSLTAHIPDWAQYTL